MVEWVVYFYHGDSEFVPKYQEVRQRALFRPFLLALSTSVLLVYVRCIYRVVEMAEGFDGYLADTEIYFMILEAMMIALSVALLTIFYPGFVYGHIHIVVGKSFKDLFSVKKERYQPKLEDN